MNLRYKIKAFFLLGKVVKVNRVESPTIKGTLFSVDNNGWCSIAGYAGLYSIVIIKRG